jgi:hypothetical protein
MTIDDQIDAFLEDLTIGKTNENTLLQRGLFLVGELDPPGIVVNEILAIKDPHERTDLMLGRLGELVGDRTGGGGGSTGTAAFTGILSVSQQK